MDGSKNGQAGEPAMVPAGAPTAAAVAKRLTVLATGGRGRSHQLRRRKGPLKGGAHGGDGAHGGASVYNSTRAAWEAAVSWTVAMVMAKVVGATSAAADARATVSTAPNKPDEGRPVVAVVTLMPTYGTGDSIRSAQGGFGSNRVWQARSGSVRLLGRLLGVEMRTRPDLVDGPAMGGSGVEGPDWVVVGLRVSRRHSAAWRRRGHDQDD
jgi:hypothetical protein